jgi:hypothetical protein
MARFKRFGKRPEARFEGIHKRLMTPAHPVFGAIEWNESSNAWVGFVRIDPFSQYDDMASKRLSAELGAYNYNRSFRDRHAEGLFPLSVLREDGSPPTRAQEGTYLRFREECDAVCESIVQAIFVDYEAMRDCYVTGNPAHDAIAVPQVEAPEGLKELIRLDGLYILDSDAGAGLLGFAFACSWEIEHGLGVLTRGTEVVRVADNSITWTGPSN